MNRKEIFFPAVVIGGGLTGICASIALARQGIRTVLVHDRSVLGGNSSSEIGVPIGGADHIGAYRHARETGILNELLLENAFFPNLSNPETSQGFSGSVWDLVLRTAIKKEKNIKLLMNTVAKQPETENGRIISIIADQHSTETEWKIHGTIFLDCSGDGRVAYESGAQYIHGQESCSEYGEDLAQEKTDNRTMGSTIYIRARDAGRPMPFRAPDWAYVFERDEDFCRGWADCPHDIKMLTGYPGGYWWLEFGGDFNTITDAEFIHEELLRYAVGVWDHIKNRGDHGAENYVLDWLGIIPGKRESRRFIGDYVLRQSDLESLRIFEDTVAYGGWNIDVHFPHGISGRGLSYWHGKDLNGRYGIPLSCLYSVNIENLLFAGRNISASHIALGSTRVMATCALMGQAVGNAAALCIKYGKTPREVRELHIHELQQHLLLQDVYLPGFQVDAAINLARQAKLSASGEAALVFPKPRQYKPADTVLCQAFFAKEIQKVILPLYNDGSEPIDISLELHIGKQLDLFVETSPVKTVHAVLPAGKHLIAFEFSCSFGSEKCCQLWLQPKKHLHWGFSPDEPPATQMAEGKGGFIRRGRGTFCLELEPLSRCYGPEQAVSGVNRPEKHSNVWISGPGFPQRLELTWEHPVTFDTIQIVFDDNLDRPLRRITDYQVAPELVRDYEIHVLHQGEWIRIVSEINNHQRLRCHRFQPVTVSALRLELLAGNGDDRARLVELRVLMQEETV